MKQNSLTGKKTTNPKSQAKGKGRVQSGIQDEAQAEDPFVKPARRPGAASMRDVVDSKESDDEVVRPARHRRSLGHVPQTPINARHMSSNTLLGASSNVLRSKSRFTSVPPGAVYSAIKPISMKTIHYSSPPRSRHQSAGESDSDSDFLLKSDSRELSATSSKTRPRNLRKTRVNVGEFEWDERSRSCVPKRERSRSRSLAAQLALKRGKSASVEETEKHRCNGVEGTMSQTDNILDGMHEDRDHYDDETTSNFENNDSHDLPDLTSPAPLMPPQDNGDGAVYDFTLDDGGSSSFGASDSEDDGFSQSIRYLEPLRAPIPASMSLVLETRSNDISMAEVHEYTMDRVPILGTSVKEEQEEIGVEGSFAIAHDAELPQHQPEEMQLAAENYCPKQAYETGRKEIEDLKLPLLISSHQEVVAMVEINSAFPDESQAAQEDAQEILLEDMDKRMVQQTSIDEESNAFGNDARGLSPLPPSSPPPLPVPRSSSVTLISAQSIESSDSESDSLSTRRKDDASKAASAPMSQARDPQWATSTEETALHSANMLIGDSVSKAISSVSPIRIDRYLAREHSPILQMRSAFESCSSTPASSALKWQGSFRQYSRSPMPTLFVQPTSSPSISEKTSPMDALPSEYSAVDKHVAPSLHQIVPVENQVPSPTTMPSALFQARDDVAPDPGEAIPALSQTPKLAARRLACPFPSLNPVKRYTSRSPSPLSLADGVRNRTLASQPAKLRTSPGSECRSLSPLHNERDEIASPRKAGDSKPTPISTVEIACTLPPIPPSSPNKDVGAAGSHLSPRIKSIYQVLHGPARQPTASPQPATENVLRSSVSSSPPHVLACRAGTPPAKRIRAATTTPLLSRIRRFRNSVSTEPEAQHSHDKARTIDEPQRQPSVMKVADDPHCSLSLSPKMTATPCLILSPLKEGIDEETTIEKLAGQVVALQQQQGDTEYLSCSSEMDSEAENAEIQRRLSRSRSLSKSPAVRRVVNPLDSPQISPNVTIRRTPNKSPAHVARRSPASALGRRLSFTELGAFDSSPLSVAASIGRQSFEALDTSSEDESEQADKRSADALAGSYTAKRLAARLDKARLRYESNVSSDDDTGDEKEEILGRAFSIPPRTGNAYSCPLTQSQALPFSVASSTPARLLDTMTLSTTTKRPTHSIRNDFPSGTPRANYTPPRGTSNPARATSTPARAISVPGRAPARPGQISPPIFSGSIPEDLTIACDNSLASISDINDASMAVEIGSPAEIDGACGLIGYRKSV